ncbi:CDP-alcohol phosphatidyltransferase family protein [Notoacmeibacter ruber]|uniref:CDP-diacylglycerol--glycerol-3-phosphate 3-phosphatidyltransferase n=1 Tax=Notoacmeibacter ruber TaxID=2670375 RepID=A0A3L7JG16_9HYPH|nr:CDP-alcohol phosphatidyltransferase family protein [Notoacmeibacter ruber]RLQ89414.1 CDP-alcohol phosphatidyltransferase family protein [Notoacmeibacter ruber]
MTIPNLITLCRLIMVPLIVWALLVGYWSAALWLFVIAGLSDAVDGALARLWGQQSSVGAYLDPIADKLLLSSTFIMLGFVGALPLWLVVIVTFRDIGILGGVLLAREMGSPMVIRPILLSKLNTAAQIVLAGLCLARGADLVSMDGTIRLFIIVCGCLTAGSAAAYASLWFRHIHEAE